MTTLPTINPGGTSARELLEQHLLAITALRSAISTLQAAAPNARDYRTGPMGTFIDAQAEHQARQRRLQETVEELAEIAEYISEQL
jgi:hypothetical protein